MGLPAEDMAVYASGIFAIGIIVSLYLLWRDDDY
jgi:hypothetical protein